MPTVIIKKYRDHYEVEVFLGYTVDNIFPIYEVEVFKGPDMKDQAIEFAKKFK